MITRLDLKLREYDGTDCVGFKMVFEDEDIKMRCDCFFKRASNSKLHWDFTAVIDDSLHEKQMVTFGYDIPSSSIKIELIAAAGLMRFKEILQNDIQAKQVLDSMLFAAVSGM